MDGKSKAQIALSVIPYSGGVVYGFWETVKAGRFNSIAKELNGFDNSVFTRATEGIQKLFDQNTGDGTIMVLGFFSAEILLSFIDLVLKRFGKNVFKSNTRFVLSAAAGIGLASYLETTTIFANTIDIPGDLFGVGLAGITILGLKSVVNYLLKKFALDKVDTSLTTDMIKKALIITAVAVGGLLLLSIVSGVLVIASP